MSRRGGAVVIGGASGLGAATALALADEGWAVTVADRDTAGGAAAVDVTDEDSVAALLDSVDDLDLVVNCAGVSTLGLVTELDAAEFRRVVETCLTGAFLVLEHAGQRVRKGGSIVMLTEVAALELAPRGIRVNAVSPGLVETPLTAPALDIPGIEDDYLDNTPLGRKGEPEEIAAAVVYLAGAQWVTGETLDINGGAHLRRYPDLYSHVMKAFA